MLHELFLWSDRTIERLALKVPNFFENGPKWESVFHNRKYRCFFFRSLCELIITLSYDLYFPFPISLRNFYERFWTSFFAKLMTQFKKKACQHVFNYETWLHFLAWLQFYDADAWLIFNKPIVCERLNLFHPYKTYC